MGGEGLALYEKFFKRMMDVALSIIALLVLLPLMFLVAVISLVILGRPILFCQPRPGKNEEIFRLYKFRSMLNLCDSHGCFLPDTDRLTPWGHFLRKSSVDELPEFFNVLKGDMSLVGPRPLAVEYLPYYREEELVRHHVRPGLTGLAQVSGRTLLNWDDRFKLDVQYVQNISFRNDLKIMFQTLWKLVNSDEVVVRGTGNAEDLSKVRTPRTGAT